MRTTEEMLDFIFTHELILRASNKRKAYEKHFELIENNLNPDEEVLLAFATSGVRNGKEVVAAGPTAAAFTANRCIYGQKSLVTANPIKIIPYDKISDVQKNSGLLLMGEITLDFLTEEASFTVDKRGLDFIFNEILKIIDDFKKTKEAQNTATTVVQQTSAADELKKFKELLDMGVISQEEFDAKKKQLLGL